MYKGWGVWLGLFLIVNLVGLPLMAGGNPRVQAATPSGSGDSGARLEVAQVPFKLKNGYQFSYKNNPANPNSIEFSWNQPNENSIVPDASIINIGEFPYIKYYFIEYTDQKPTTASCKANSGWTQLARVDERNNKTTRTVRTIDNGLSTIRNASYFRLRAGGRSYQNGNVLEPLDPPVPLVCGTTAIDPYGALPSGEIPIRFTSTPSGAKVTIDGKDIKTFSGGSQPKTLTNVTLYMQPEAAPKALEEGHIIEFTLTGYKPWSSGSGVTFHTPRDVSATLVKESSSDNSTGKITDHTGDAAGGINPTPNADKLMECSQFLGVKWDINPANVFRFEPAKYVACQIYNAIILTTDYMEKIYENIPL